MFYLNIPLYPPLLRGNLKKLIPDPEASGGMTAFFVMQVVYGQILPNMNCSSAALYLYGIIN